MDYDDYGDIIGVFLEDLVTMLTSGKTRMYGANMVPLKIMHSDIQNIKYKEILHNPNTSKLWAHYKHEGVVIWIVPVK